MRRIFFYLLGFGAFRLIAGTKSNKFPFGWLAFTLWNTVALVGLLTGGVAGIALLVGGLALGYPWLTARALFIPLGLWWPAFWLGKLAGLTWSSAGGAIAGSLALLNKRKPSARGLARIDADIRRGVLTTPKIVAAALLAECRGDRATARRLMRSLELLDHDDEARSHRLSRDFLIADAAEFGDWHRVRTLALAPVPTSRLGRLFGKIAARLEGDDSITDASLWLAWATARNRRQSWPFLRRALGERRSDHAEAVRWPEAESIELSIGGDPVGAALDAHVTLLRRAPEVEIDDLIALATLWDRAIESGALREQALARAADLQIDGANLAVDDFAHDIECEISTLVRRSGVCIEVIPTGSAMLSRAIASVRRQLLAEIELAFAALEVRFEADRTLDSIDEWREMLALRELHSNAARIGGLPLRQIAFPQMHTPTCNFAVWLWNSRAEYLIADTIFRWLLAEATIVGDAEAIELQTRNVD